jgi:hypothetical protein
VRFLSSPLTQAVEPLWGGTQDHSVVDPPPPPPPSFSSPLHSLTRSSPITGEGAVRQYVPKLEDLLWSANSTNVTISGSGTVDGQGWRWWPLRNDTTHGEYWHNCRPSLVSAGRTVGPRGEFYDSGVSDFSLLGVTLLDSPFWVVSGRGLKRALFSHVHVTTTICSGLEHQGDASLAPNTDGINIQGEDIVVEHCTVRNGDDCVPIFPPSRNISVHNISCSCGNGLTIAIWGRVLFLILFFYTGRCHWFPRLLRLKRASRRATNGIPLGCSLFLPVHIVHCVQTLKVSCLGLGEISH